MAEKAKAGKVSGGKRAVGLIGGIAFAVAFILAIVGGIIARDNSGVVLSLVILGIVVALLNITAKEVMPILIAAVALIVAGGTGMFAPLDSLVNGLGKSLNGLVAYMSTFMVPVAVISAVRAVMALSRPGN